jgi:hypothetical protein
MPIALKNHIYNGFRSNPLNVTKLCRRGESILLSLRDKGMSASTLDYLSNIFGVIASDNLWMSDKLKTLLKQPTGCREQLIDTLKSAVLLLPRV